MLKKERQSLILQKVNLHNRVLSSILSGEIDVSEDTIRRDLQELSDEGKLIKVHGGALSLSFTHHAPIENDIYSYPLKKAIAIKAALLLEEGMFILTSGGTTIIELAKIIPKDLGATFISGSLPVVMEYMKLPKIDVIVIGDKISKNARITVGSDAINQIKQFNADICFMGVNAIDSVYGITDNDWEVVQVKKAMIAASKKLVCLSIAEKVNTCQPIQICAPEKIDVLITELNPNNNLFNPYKEKGIKVL
jgi:DeoR/GlpR family transcriptional regulator of sugar metabolism